MKQNFYLWHGMVVLTLIGVATQLATAQQCYWQQRADYTIRAVLNPTEHRYEGLSTIIYANNSPDTLTELYFHLYNNAFQPGSAMDVRSRTISDPDARVGDRIANLTSAQQGYLHMTQLRVNGMQQIVDEQGTIAVVRLTKPLLPGQAAYMEIEFAGQVPLQVRRSGRDNKEGVDYSMSQWYPKLSAYDSDGWHPNPYVGREFYGVWGDFDVTVALPREYVFAGTGYPAFAKTAAEDPAFAALVKRVLPKGAPADLRLHRRQAPLVHDFSWAADTEYVLDSLMRTDGIQLEIAYIPGEKTTDNWQLLLPIMDEAMSYANAHFGQYPYRKYAFLQGGDGGMEYAMCTLITGERTLNSLVGVSVHEMMHSWYQFVLATDEAQYPWMDEGFTSYASAEIMNHLMHKGLLPGAQPVDNPHAQTAAGYARYANLGITEPLTTHADHYTTNGAYGIGSYIKGELFLHQLRTVIGDSAFQRGMLRYYNTWKMRHPTPRDFIRIMERESGQVLDWYLEYMLNTNHQIDYAIDTVTASAKTSTLVTLSRQAPMPFPLTITVETAGAKTLSYLIPIDLQRGHAPAEGQVVLEPWAWVNPTYQFELPMAMKQIATVSINAATDHSEASKDGDIWPRPIQE